MDFECYFFLKKQGGMPETSLRKTVEKPNFWRFPVHPRGKYLQFLMRNPIFRSKIVNSGNQGRKHGKT